MERQNPEIEISVSDATYAWIRLHGTALFCEKGEEMLTRNVYNER